jgi:hypothetical protein
VARTALSLAGPILEVGVLAGLILRRRLHESIALPCLMAALVVSTFLVVLCPACNTWRFWLAKELVHASVFAWLGIEVALLATREPAARRAAWRWIGCVAVLSVPLLAFAPRGAPAVEIVPRLMGSIAWLYTGLAVVMLRHDVRLTLLQDTILAGFTPYLIVYAATWNRAATDTAVANIVNPILFLLVLVALTIAAWRRDTAPCHRPRSRTGSGRAITRRTSAPPARTPRCASTEQGTLTSSRSSRSRHMTT